MRYKHKPIGGETDNMFNISSNKIVSLERGDTGSIRVELNMGTAIDKSIYTLKDGDKVYLGVAEPNHRFEESVIRKVFDKEGESFASFKLEPSDTVCLTPGNYYWTVKLVICNESGQDDVHTIVSRKRFIVEE